MNSPKRQRPAHGDDDSEHMSKKIAMSGEEIPAQQTTTTVSCSDTAKLASQEPAINNQDTETAEETVIPPLESSQDAVISGTDANIPLKQSKNPQEGDTGTTNTNRQLISPKYKPTHRDDYSERFERRLVVLESRLDKLDKSFDERQPKELPDVTIVSGVINNLVKEQHMLQRQLGLAHGNTKTARDELEAIRAERDVFRERTKELQKQNNQLEEDLEIFAIVKQSAPDLDTTLIDQFSDLRATVRSFAERFCDNKISIKSLPRHVLGVFQAISGIAASRLLGSRLHARYFVEGLIWRILDEEILENPFRIWGSTSTVGTIAIQVQSNINVAASTRQLWRTMTGQLLSTKLQPAKSKISSLQWSLVCRLRSLVRDEFKDSIQDHVGPIIKDTINFAITLSQSRSLCAVYRKEPNVHDTESQRYNDKWMEIIEKSVDHFEDIDFIVSPALVQLTNSAGEEFRSPRVMVKAEVCFGQGRTSTDLHPTSAPALCEKGQAKTAPSGRHARAVKRYGNTANEDQVTEAIGITDKRSPIYISDEYQDKTSPAEVQSNGSSRTQELDDWN
ncbi:hypothetical protein F5Y09DRAFT_340169 [Xylaria sp. FL1042]|nr:hypothetical protein F5Y09DRAFT_340169 [Xylaria sp. FL1042]